MDNEYLKKLIEKISVAYREQSKKADETNKKIEKIYLELQDENISHKYFLKLQMDLQYLESKHKEEMNIATGMSLAREELFSEFR